MRGDMWTPVEGHQCFECWNLMITEPRTAWEKTAYTCRSGRRVFRDGPCGEFARKQISRNDKEA